MRAYELLTEGTGLRGGKPGEIYNDRDGTEYEFQVWDFKYPNDAPQFESLTQMEEVIEEITRTNPNVDIRWVNNPSNRTKA